jgi:hypothetical protein
MAMMIMATPTKAFIVEDSVLTEAAGTASRV